MNNTIIVTKSELQAHYLWNKANGQFCSTNSNISIHESANKIIELAERIKAERIVFYDQILALIIWRKKNIRYNSENINMKKYKCVP